MEIKKILRFLVSGGVASLTHLGLLYIFTDIFGFWYIFSLNLAFVFAFFVSFGLQKFWTFEDKKLDGAHKQAFIYFIVVSANLLLNNILVYFMVENLHLWYIFAQIIAEAVIAVESFVVYRNFIFKK